MYPARTYLFTFLASFRIYMNFWIYFINIPALNIRFFLISKDVWQLPELNNSCFKICTRKIVVVIKEILRRQKQIMVLNQKTIGEGACEYIQ